MASTFPIMWTVKVDSNVPVKAVTATSTDGFISEKFLKEYQKVGDVEKLLGSQSSMRARSSSLTGRPPPSPSTHTSTFRSQSPSSITRRQAYSLDTIITKTSKDKQHQTSHPTDDVCGTGNTGHRPENKSDVMHQACGKFGITGSSQVPFKADHNMSTSLLESYHRISSSTAQRCNLTSDDIKSGTTCRINRSRSLSRLNMSTNGESVLLPDSRCGSEDVSELQRALEESESQRKVLMQQQKAAEATLQLQSEQLNKIVSSANNNNMLVENLLLKEKQYHNIFKQLQVSEQEKQVLQAHNLRLQEEMQNRINTLDYQLRHLKSQHHSTESKNNNNITLLDHTTTALSMMEGNNLKLQKDKDTLQSEISLLKESLDLAKTRYGAMEDDNRNMRNESVKLKEMNSTLSRKIQEVAGQMIELHSLLKAVKDENERLISTLKTYTEDKSWTVKQTQGYQDTISHLKIRLSAVSADRDRLFQEKLDMNNKLQHMMFDKEHLMKTQLILEDQLSEQMPKQSYTKASEFKFDKKDMDLAQEHASMKKVKEELSAELTLLKGLYEQALEQIAVLDWDKSVLKSQCDLSEQERSQQQQEVNRFSQDSVRKNQQPVKHHLTLTESEKLQEEFEKLQLEYNNLKHKYDSLVAKHQQIGRDSEVEEKAELEMIKLKKEKEAVQKQVAYLQGQMLLLEGSKKRAEEQVYKLTSDIGELQVQLKENNKSAPKEESLLRQEVEMLKLHLDKAKEDQQLQHNFIESLREKTVNDERLETQQLKEKLHELFRELEQKNKTIDSLKFDLKSFKETAEAKQREVQDLYNAMEEIKSENQILRQNVQVFDNSGVILPQEKEQQIVKQPQLLRKLQEKLLKAAKSKQKDSFDKSNTCLSSSWDLQMTNDVPDSQASKTFSTENSSHLQNVISNDQSKKDNEVASIQQITNSMPRSEPSKLFSKSWAPVPKLQFNSAGSSVNTATSQENNSFSQVKSIKPARKLPPPPPPKPMSKSSLSMPTENTSKDTDVLSSAFDISTTESSSVKWPVLSSASTSTSLSSSGLGQPTFSTESQDEPQEHGKINGLILKFEEMAAF